MSYIAVPRTTNWNHFNKFIPSKPNIKLEPWARKAELVKRIMKRYPDPTACSGVVLRKSGKSEVAYNHLIYVITERSTLDRLKIALATNDRVQIKKAINIRINLRGRKKCVTL